MSYVASYQLGFLKIANHLYIRELTSDFEVQCEFENKLDCLCRTPDFTNVIIN